MENFQPGQVKSKNVCSGEENRGVAKQAFKEISTARREPGAISQDNGRKIPKHFRDLQGCP